jgi:hypothetical protein
VGSAGTTADNLLGSVGNALPGVDNTVSTVGQTADNLVGTVGNTADNLLGAVGNTLPAVDNTISTVGQTADNLLGSVANTLPAVDNTVNTVGQTAQDLLGALDGTSLLNLNADLNLDLNLAAPVSLGVAANANAAVPIDGSVTANVLSPDSSSFAAAPQHDGLEQQLAGEATATSGQNSAIAQGADPSGLGNVVTSPSSAVSGPAPTDSGAVTPADGATAAGSSGSGGPLLPDLSSLLNLNVKLDLGLDLAAPINGAIAANANVAAPIDAAVGANILSPNSSAVALAPQDDIIIQTLQGVANATTNQASTINQAGLPTA